MKKPKKPVGKTPKVVVKKRRAVRKKTRPQKAELISRARLFREMRVVMYTLGCVRTDLTAIRKDIAAIRYVQETITRSVDAVMKDYIRHPLKIDGMNQQAFRSLVDAATRKNPEMFRDDFNGRLEELRVFDG